MQKGKFKPRVLLLGDYSGYFLNLSKGFERIGWKVSYFSDGDYWKKIEGTPYPAYQNSYLGKVRRIANLYSDRKLFSGYDMVLFLSPRLILNKRNALTLESLLKNNQRVVYCACGSHDPYFQDSLPTFQYHPFDHVDISSRTAEYPKLNREESLKIKEGINRLHAVVAISPMYAAGYADVGIEVHKIPLPVSDIAKKIKDTNKRQLIIQHGISRRGFKGSNYILEAMSNAYDKFPSKIQLDIIEKIPYKDYLSRLEQADVVIDQCKSMGYGMNALLAMARGKIVLSGKHSLLKNFIGVNMDEIPIVGITPDTRAIQKEIERIANLGVSQFNQHKIATLEYTKQHHSAEIIAAKFVDLLTLA